MGMWQWILIGTALGALFGYLITFLFGKFPESWLQDYDYDVNSSNFRLAKRMKYIPHGIISSIGMAMCYALSVYFAADYFIRPFYMKVAVILLIMPVLFLIIMSDKLNRIIPDQFSIYLLFLGIIAAAGDYLEGSIWFSSAAAWYLPLLNKIIGAIVGGGFLWVINQVSISFTGRVGMGGGDVKLMFALGLLSGCYGLVVILYVSVFSALIFAIPMLIRKHRRIKKEEEIIRNSDNPRKKRRELELKRARIHYSEDPDYLAFGPFLAIGCAVFIAAEPFIYSKMFSIFNAMGVMF